MAGFDRVGRRVIGVVMALVLVYVAAPACKRGAGKSSAGAAASAAVDPPPASESEAATFIQRVQKAVAAHAIPDDIIDWDELLKRGLGEATMSPDFAKGARKGASERFISELNAVLARGGTYRLLANRLVGGQRRVRFRMVDADGGFNYHDYVLVHSASGVSAVDLFVLLTGEAMSTSVRRVMLPIVVSQSRGLLERLTTEDGDLVKNIDKVQQLSAFKQNPKAALAAYATLPRSLQHDKSVLLLRINAASAAGETEYAAAIGDFRRLHPKDACVDVLSLDYYVLAKQYDLALEALDRLQKKEGDDPYLGVVRANLLFLKNERKAAEQSLESSLAADPDLVEAMRLLIIADLADRNLRQASELAVRARTRGLSLGEVEKDPSFVALTQSREYKAAAAAAPSAAPSAP